MGHREYGKITEPPDKVKGSKEFFYLWLSLGKETYQIKLI